MFNQSCNFRFYPMIIPNNCIKETLFCVHCELCNFTEKGSDPFDMLPEGWVLVTHNSGMPVYLHKQSRVVTFSKPYFIGPGSVRVSFRMSLYWHIMFFFVCLHNFTSSLSITSICRNM